MRKLKKKKRTLRYQTGGQIPTPLDGLKQAVERSRSQGYLNPIKNPVPPLPSATGALGYPMIDPIDLLAGVAGASRLFKSVPKTPKVLEGRDAQQYLKQQMADRAEKEMAEMDTWTTYNPENYGKNVTGTRGTEFSYDFNRRNTPINTFESLRNTAKYSTTNGGSQSSARYKLTPPGSAFADDNLHNAMWDKVIGTPGKNQFGGPITDPRGQLKYPGAVTKIPSNNISMQGVNYPVLGISNTGASKMMQPGASYTFPGSSVTEYPMMAQKGLLSKNMMKDGGSNNQFPQEISFPEKRKNEFLTFLKNTSFDKIKEDLDNTLGFEQEEIDMLKKGGYWIQTATKGMRKDKPCTGAKFGSSSCPAGSKRYNLAKTFRKMNKQAGGELDKYQYGKQYGPRATGNPDENFGYTVDNRNSFFDPYNTNVPLDVKNLKTRNNSPYHPAWDYIPNTGQKWQPHTDMSWMDQKDPNQLGYSPPQGFSQGQSWGQKPQGSAMDINSDHYNMENVNRRAADESGEGITGRPNWKDRWWANPDIINAGMEGVTSIFNMFDRKKKEKELRKRTSADSLWSSSAGSRGDYTTNNGYFRPDQMTPVQFPGQAGFQQYQDGGEYNLTQEEINNLLDNFEIEYLD